MDKDRIEGAAKNIKGKVKQKIGKAVGDSKMETEGAAERVAGKAQNAYGSLKDTLRGE